MCFEMVENKMNLDMYECSVHKKGFCGQATSSSKIMIRPLNINRVCDLWNIEEYSLNTISALQKIPASVTGGVLYMKIMDEMKNSRKPILFKIIGPFSTLVQMVSSENAFKWLKNKPSEMERAMSKIADALIEFVENMSSIGVKVFSYSEPTMIYNLLGDRYLNVIFKSNMKLLKRIDNSSLDFVIHLCPSFSPLLLEKSLLVEKETICSSESVFETLLTTSYKRNSHITGHSCIYAEYGDLNLIKIYEVITV